MHALIRRPAATLAAAVLVALSGCGSDPARPTDDDDGGNPPPAGPQPGGVLLDGDATAPALGALRDLPPSPIDPADARDGVYASRLTAIVAAGATVGAVNAALEAHGARIVAMDPGMPLVTLVIGPVADAAAADAAAAALAAEDAFSSASSVPDPDAGALAPGAHPRAEPTTSAHFRLSRMHAARNAADLAVQRNNVVVVLVPDWYQDLTPHPEIEHAIVGNGLVSDFGLDEYLGNHGFHASGVIAASASSDFDAFHPAPASLIEVRSVPMGGMPWLDRVRLVADRIPPGRPVVISNSRGYEDPDFHLTPRSSRALQAAMWRYKSSPFASNLFVATAAGDEGQAAGVGGSARFGTFYGVSADHPDLLDAVDGLDPAYAAELQALIDAEPSIAVAPDNIATVGSSDESGAEDPATSREYDVRTVGHGVAGPCVIADPGITTGHCTGSTAFYSGSGTAAPQVAALAAYLWNLDPSRTPEQLRTAIDNAYIQSNAPGVVDAYTAVLSLDPSLDSGLPMPVRLALLDVAGGSSAGAFDEADLQVFLDAFANGQGPITDATARYDLNGDGNIADGGAARFDLDGNVIGYSTVTSATCSGDVDYDEASMTDTGILRYYARTRLYSGDPDARDKLLDDCGGGQDATVTLGNYRFSASASANAGPAHKGDSDVVFQQVSGSVGAAADTSHSGGSPPDSWSYSAAGSSTITWAVAVSGSTGSAQVVTASGNGNASFSASYHASSIPGVTVGGSTTTSGVVPFVVGGAPATFTVAGSTGSLTGTLEIGDNGSILHFEKTAGPFSHEMTLDPGEYYVQVSTSANRSVFIETEDLEASDAVTDTYEWSVTFDVP